MRVVSQSKLSSLAEAISNTTVGYFISVGAGQFIYPLFGVNVTLFGNMGITLAFTVVAIIRSYCMRRYFNYRDRERF